MKVYSIYNRRLQYYNKPFYAENDAEAKTYILNILASDSDRYLSLMKDDLALCLVSTFDTVTGCFNTDSEVDITSPWHIVDISDLYKLLPDDRVPRDSLYLRSRIEELQNTIEEKSTAFASIVDQLKLHFKFLRKDTKI